MSFFFGQKSKFVEELHELEALVLSQSIGFAAEVVEEVEGLGAQGAIFSAKPDAGRLYRLGLISCMPDEWKVRNLEGPVRFCAFPILTASRPRER